METLNEETIVKITFEINFAFEALDTFVKVSSDLRFSEVPVQTFELGLLKSLDLKYEQTKVTKTKVDNIFETKEIETKVEEIKEQPIEEIIETPESIQEKIEKTMELTLNQEAIEESMEDDAQSVELQEEILNQSSFKNTDELNIGNLFSIDEVEKEEVKESKSQFTVDEIINLLVQTDKSVHADNKNK